MPRSVSTLQCSAIVIAVVMSGTYRGSADSADIDFFERKIRPVLVEQCYDCHSIGAETIKADFLLDTRDGIRKGGVSGRDAVIPGDVAGSQLIEAIRYQNEELQMPPNHALPESVVADFEAWIAMGAPDPRDGVSKLPREIAAEHHWAWKRPVRHDRPDVANKDWPRDTVDHFVLAKLEANAMAPNPDADRRTLIRRATLELTGLPPRPENIAAFLADSRPDADAFAEVVDRLLASPEFGVRWARHWLDVARFGESSGYSRNMLYPYAWRYRNYVIDSFNADKPFDRFIQEQIAGDLLPDATDETRIGTGFLTIGAKTFNEGNELLFHLNSADDQIDVTCRAFLALTANCSRCHDHKYDPIPTKDYYAMAGIFLSSRNLAGSETNVRNEHSEAFPLGENGWKQLDDIAAAKKKADKEQAYYMELVKIRNDLRKPLVDQGIDWKKAPTPELADAEAKVQAQQAVVKETKAAIPDPPDFAMAVVEGLTEAEAEGFAKKLEEEKALIAELKKAKKPAINPTPKRPTIQDSPVYDKGLFNSPLDPVTRSGLSLFDYETPPIGKTESGRRQLADWVVDSRNPLTARVFVNRVWHHLFGRGLVETVDNFGLLGSAPSHPELLDELALDFMESGWSVKALIRRLVLTRTFAQSSTYHSQYAATDPDNTMLWRFAPQLLEGEVIRDSILAVSDHLDRARPDGSQVLEISKQQVLGRQREIGRRDYYQKDVDWNIPHRSIYLPMARGVLPDMLATFDAPDPNLVVGARKLTIVPTQALYLMNSEMVLEQSTLTAKRVIAHSQDRRIDFAYELILGRSPLESERQTAATFLQSNGHSEQTWTRLCQALMCSGEFRTVY
tara:strand:+ start:994 stop:3537 length:2544 start_codon:yes stop_codon:yes gene_type:complete